MGVVEEEREEREVDITGEVFIREVGVFADVVLRASVGEGYVYSVRGASIVVGGREYTLFHCPEVGCVVPAKSIAYDDACGRRVVKIVAFPGYLEPPVGAVVGTYVDRVRDGWGVYFEVVFEGGGARVVDFAFVDPRDVDRRLVPSFSCV